MVKPTIMVECQLCGAGGGVQDFTQEEWALAFYAPSMPFRWADESRVILAEDLPEVTAEDWQSWEDFKAQRRQEVKGLTLTKTVPVITGLKLTDTRTGETVAGPSPE